MKAFVVIMAIAVVVCIGVIFSILIGDDGRGEHDDW